MTYSRSPESPNRKLKKIELPKEIKIFFAQRGKFLRGLPSYEQIEGKDPENHDDAFDWTYGYGLPLVETRAVNNKNSDIYAQSQRRAKDLAKVLFGVSNSEIAEPLREYMLTGGTKPIKVTTTVQEKERKVYVKMPSVERIVGLTLYNMISGNEPIDFVFSEYVFAENSVSGIHIDKTNISYMQRLKELGRSIIRARVIDNFLGINDLDREVNLREKPEMLANLLVQSDGQIKLFDVDCAFTRPFPEYNLVEIARKKEITITEKDEIDIEKDEAKRINHIINTTSKRTYRKFIEAIAKIESLRKQFKKIGFKTPEDYFDEKERWLNSKIK
jgi:hypothetical protein